MNFDIQICDVWLSQPRPRGHCFRKGDPPDHTKANSVVGKNTILTLPLANVSLTNVPWLLRIHHLATSGITTDFQPSKLSFTPSRTCDAGMIRKGPPEIASTSK